MSTISVTRKTSASPTARSRAGRQYVASQVDALTAAYAHATPRCERIIGPAKRVLSRPSETPPANASPAHQRRRATRSSACSLRYGATHDLGMVPPGRATHVPASLLCEAAAGRLRSSTFLAPAAPPSRRIGRFRARWRSGRTRSPGAPYSLSVRRDTPRTMRSARKTSVSPFGSDPVGVQAMLAAIVDSADDAIVSTDLNATIVSWNAAAERIFGSTAEEAIGRPIAMLLPPERRNEEGTSVATLRRGERIEHFETVRLRKDGRRINVSISVSPIRDSTGAIVGAAKITRDITERKEMEAERERLLGSAQAARAEAEAANRAKDEFLSVVSHELRTPLAAMLGWISVLRQGRLSPGRAARALETVERSGKIQAALIDDLLDVSRIISGRLGLTMGPTHLAAVVHAAVEAIRPDAVAAGIALTAGIETDVLVSGDETRLQQVLANVLGNAIKFTPEDGRVDVRLEHVGEEARVTVCDTGRGISRAFLPHVFDPFRQGEDVSSRKTRGLGLGLAIVHELLHRHGGSVVVDSAGEGLGTTVTLTLPALPAGAGVEGDADDARLDGVRILVVDDDRDVRDGLRAVLEDRGALVILATSASDARRHLAAVRPDVLVSDIRLPGEDGYAFLRAVRAGLSAPALPAVAITAYEADETSERALAAGFHAHFAKPFDPDALIDTIAALAGRQKVAP